MGAGGARKGNFASVRNKLSNFNSNRKGKGSKGKGKGKGKRPAAIKSPFWEKKKDEENRTELDGTYCGKISRYNFKFGWGHILPDDVSAFPEEAVTALERMNQEAKEKAQERGKDEPEDNLVYFRKPDVDPELFPLDTDEAVTFELYTDDRGIGAHKVHAVEGAPPKERPPPREERSQRTGLGRTDNRKGKASGKGRDSHSSGKGRGPAEQKHVIELEETDASFEFRKKIVGEGGANVRHIEDASQARVQVSRHQPLKIDITASNKRGVDSAVKLIEDLVSHVWKEYEQTKRPQRSKGSGKESRHGSSSGSGGKGSGGKAAGGKAAGGKSSGGKVSRVIKLKYCDPAFRLRGHLVGQGGQYVKHIQDTCKCGVDIVEENGEMRVNLSSDTQANLDKGKSMLQDLIDVAYTKYEEWKKERGSKSGKGGKGDKGKGKREPDRGRADEHANKRRRY